MNHKMQFGNFTHGKCLNCGFLAQIDRFNSKPYERVVFTEIKVNGDATVDAFAFVLECPKCSSLNTEALFVDEVN